MHYRSISVTDSVKSLLFIKYPLIVIAAISSYQTHAAPSNMGSITVTSSNASAGTASGTYTAAGSGATGTFTLTRNETRGYTGIVDIVAGNNGIEIRNRQDVSSGNDRDRFKYTFTITPNNNSAIHTIKIGQASYTTNGNSEIARQTLAFVKNSQINIPIQANIVENPDVPYYYNAMGDYFMGTKLSSTQLNSQNAVSNPQLRVDSTNASGSGLYYYNIPNLTGANGNTNPYTPTLNNNQVTLDSNTGILPPTPTFDNIIKIINNSNTYNGLIKNTAISNGGTYVSYGIENTQSNYVVAVKNAQSVTLTYEGIMIGNIGVPRAVVGETFNEWISFGVESEPVYVFSGTIFNDNGGINDANANANTINGIYDNARFFDGIFQPAPTSPAEIGINGSTVQLADDCTKSTPTVYATKVIPDSDVGRYQFNILPSELNGRTSVCLIETRTNSNDGSYPIRTTTNQRTVNLIGNTFNYSGNDFGRVIAKNAALVLEKEQVVNSCTINSLTALAYSKSPVIDVPPGQCIAYRITANNRANLQINQVIVTDILQKRDPNNPNGPKVTSSLNLPERTSVPTRSYSDNVQNGSNGTIVTSPFEILAKGKQIFYFNTKYGTTTSNP